MVNKNDFIQEKSRKILTTGRTIALLRELKGWTQKDLSLFSNISATNISLLESGRIEIGKKRAIKIAKAFGIHPAVIIFPEYISSGFLINAA